MDAPAHMATGTTVSLEQMLAAREQRAARQAAALARFDKPLVSMTVVMPGPVKDGWLPRRVLEVALRELEAVSSARHWPVLAREVWWQETGPEALYVMDVEAQLLKSATVHQAETVSLIADYADRALLAELMLTPKPGLVDRRNSGAHRGMDLQTFLASARAIAPWWPRFVEIGYAWAHMPAGAFLPLVRPTGVLCERAMLQATDGVNTHKGAIFSLGLLCAAAGRLLAKRIELNRERICAEVAHICVGLVDRELNGTRAAHTAGERIFRRHGLTGARGEAAAGYALVRTVALPVYDRLRLGGVGEDVALLQVRLHLLAVNGDTNLVSRGGLAGLNYVRENSGKLLGEGGALAPDGVKKMEAFDDELIARHLSPGGSTDLLAVTWFLARFPKDDLMDMVMANWRSL